MSRELDEACARAMGWTQLRMERIKARPRSGICGGGGEVGRDDDSPSLLGNPADGSSPYPCARHVPRYSDDPSTDAEKIAWLKGDLRIDRDFGAVAFAERSGDQSGQLWSATLFGVPSDANDDGVRVGSGATMTEALARLVVAVAAEGSKQ